MSRLLLKSIGVASGLVLLLPPGWCTLVAGGSQSAPAAVASCCRHESRQSSDCHSPNGRGPQNPIAPCCCAQDATVAEKTATPAHDSMTVALAALPQHAMTGVDHCPRGSEPAPLAAGPGLQILLCVWRI